MSAPNECSIVETQPRQAAVIKAEVAMAEIPATQRALRPKLKVGLQAMDVGPLGDTLTAWSPPMDGRMALWPGVLVSRASAAAGEIEPVTLPAGRAAHLLMQGPYDGLPAAWGRLFAWCKAEQLPLAGRNWEIYHDDPDPAAIRIELYALLA